MVFSLIGKTIKAIKSLLAVCFSFKGSEAKYWDETDVWMLFFSPCHNLAAFAGINDRRISKGHCHGDFYILE